MIKNKTNKINNKLIKFHKYKNIKSYLINNKLI